MGNLGQWYSVYGGTDAWTTEMAAVSSFPHNDLGKDFRFNVRILHKGGAGDPTATGVKDSYYWYKVDEIKIQFPDVVRCPREMKNLANGTAGYGDVKGSGTVAQKLPQILSDAWTVPTTTDTVDGTQLLPRTTETPTGTIPMLEKILTSHGTSKTSEKIIVSLVLPTPDKMSVIPPRIPMPVSSVVPMHLLTVNGSNVVHTTLSKVL